MQQPGQQNTPSPGPTDIPSSLRPGTSPFADMEDENNIWAEGVPALARQEDMSGVPAVLRPGSSGRREASTDQVSDAASTVPAVLQPGEL